MHNVMKLAVNKSIQAITVVIRITIIIIIIIIIITTTNKNLSNAFFDSKVRYFWNKMFE